MPRALRIASWIFFLAMLYLVAADAAFPWFSIPTLGNIGFTLVFVVFSLFHCTALEGLRRTALFFLISAVVSWLLEETGVRTGLIYGSYHYSDQLGAKLGHVPIVIPLAWFMMIYPSWTVARALLGGIGLQSFAGRAALAAVGACVLTAWDVVMDPGMSAGGVWVWEHGGAWFGVPRHNYLGWLFTTFLIYWLTSWFWRRTTPRTAAARSFELLPVLLYASIAVRYVFDKPMPALQMIALFSMGVPAMVALFRIALGPEPPAAASLPV